MITPNPSQPQTVISTMDISASCGSRKKPWPAMPTLLSIAFTSPKSGSSSQLNIVAVATVEVTTGTNTATR